MCSSDLSVRGFAGERFFERIRRRPSAALLALMRRRIERFDDATIRARVDAVRHFGDSAPGVRRPGRAAPHHTHWVFPVLSDDPDALAQALRAAGFDATRGASSMHAMDGAGEALRDLMEHLLYLPVYAGVSDRELARLAALVAGAHVGAGEAAPALPGALH